jgi:hypothetical protein
LQHHKKCHKKTPLGDLHVNFNTRQDHFLDVTPLQHQAEQISKLAQIFWPMQVVLVEPTSQSGTPERIMFVVQKIQLFECLGLQHTTEFIIIHGVKKARCGQVMFEGCGRWI